MSDKPVPLTHEGKAKLEADLVALRAERKVIAERIHDAQEQGTSQNDAEYDDAKQEQGMLEGRIREIEDILRRARPIDEDVAGASGRVQIGSVVEVEQDGKARHYRIVGTPEADPAQGKISNESPVGSALLGRGIGETVEIHVPRGVSKIKILKIE